VTVLGPINRKRFGKPETQQPGHVSSGGGEEETEIGFWAGGSPYSGVGGRVESYGAGCVGECHGEDEGLGMETIGWYYYIGGVVVAGRCYNGGGCKMRYWLVC
jgi:hypothetical protein